MHGRVRPQGRQVPAGERAERNRVDFARNVDLACLTHLPPAHPPACARFNPQPGDERTRGKIFPRTLVSTDGEKGAKKGLYSTYF